MGKSNLFKGLAATFAVLVPVAAYMSVLAYDREGDINLFLGITAGAAANEGAYKSAYNSKEDLLKDEELYQIQTIAEGSVLLRNENKALPLSKKNVTLFGNAAVYSNYHGGSGGPNNAGYTLLDSLKDEGFSVNEKVYNKIKENGYKAKNKDIAEVDPAIYEASDCEGYKDAAIVVISRYGGEENDLELVDTYGVPELSFHERERQTLEFVKAQGFEKVIVILNTGYAMETGWLKDYCDAALWVAFPGSYGFKGVAQLISGKQSPSGRLVDIYATNSFSSPAMSNFGDFGFTDLPNNNYHHEYVVYAEGIYAGYRYYETRYADLIEGTHNANSVKGVKASNGNWNYAEGVAYPFGFGLSYASFNTTLDSVTWNTNTHKVEAKVTVKNTDSQVSAKHSVPLYASLP